MGIGTIGTAIGKEIIAWTRTGGKSLLATRPVKVNTAGLRLAPKLEGDIVQISNHKAGTILNTKTGIHENVTFSDLPSKVDNGKHYILTAYNQNGEAIGNVSFKRLNRRDKQPCLYINYLGTAEGYKGIGSEIVRKLVQLSERLGMGGRIKLEACTGDVPYAFRLKGFANKCKTSAAIKYKKMGFNADRWTEKELQKEIACGGNGFRQDESSLGKYMRDIFGGIEMDLGEDAIKRYLEGF